LPLAALPLLLLFASTLFVSATLLFLVQPMIGKMLLPMLGGTPAVWNTCMVFFQALLLAGYAYAHATTAWLGVRRQAVLHLGVLLLPFLTLGLAVDRGLLDYGEGSPIPGLLLVLLLSVGLPFFVVSTSAPLLQKWFAGTGHPAAEDPYFLYGASNLGSMLALFGYPLAVEPGLALAHQRLLWQVGYGVLVVLTAACAVCLWRSRNPDKETRRQGDKETEALAASGSVTLSPCHLVTLSPWRRLRWVALAFVPSSLMLGATTHMTTDIAPIPLLWVLPLGLYLLSFILVFSRLPALVHRMMVVLLPLLVLLLVFLMLSELGLHIGWKILVHLAVLFGVAMVCHGELARDRPPTRYLTEFYLWMSVGGVLGGLFNALVAPVIFNGIVEYPLALVLACLLLPTLEEEKQTRLGPVLGTGLMGLFLGVGLALVVPALGRSDLDLTSLAGVDGLWLVAAFLVALLLVRVGAPADREERVARWLDLGLPVALGVLAIGLNVGLPITTMHRGLERLYARFHDALPDWVPDRFVTLLDFSSTGLLILLIFVLPVVLCYFFVKRPLRFGLGVGALLLANSFCDMLNSNVQLRARSFFGVLHVSDAGNLRRLEHGTTLHGQQRLRWSDTALAVGAACPLAASDPLGSTILLAAGQETWLHPGREPQTYFHYTSPIGQVFAAYQDRLAGRHVGLIGLGSGTLASYGQPGQKLTYYEIDPLVKRVAYDRAYFTFVPDALDRGVLVDVVLGDARLKLEERARGGSPEKFALLVVDAFSSDAIPVHLITREALAIYLDNLADDGFVAFHISNRYLDLEPVLGNLAAELGLASFIQHDGGGDIPGKAASTWVVLARQESTLDRLLHEGRWEQWQAEQGWAASADALRALTAFPDTGGSVQALGTVYHTLFERLRAPWRRPRVRPEVGLWTDDYSNLLRVFYWQN
jgi:hypothetical protein